MADGNHGCWFRQAQSIALRLRRAEGLPFADLLDARRILEVLSDEGCWFRDCVFGPLLTVWTFLTQVLSADQSCRNAVARARAFLLARGEEPCSVATGPYCKARQRLPERVFRRLARDVAADLHQRGSGDLLSGRPIKIIDGTTVSMPDTPENQAEYPQPTTQKPGLGFPLARAVALICLTYGVVLEIALGKCRGKETGETALFRSLWEHLEPGDVVLGDRYFASYWTIALLLERGVDSVFRMHHRRLFDFRRGRRLAADDHVVTWTKPKQCPDWMDEVTFQRVPEFLSVREMRVAVWQPGFRVRVFVVVTTLLDAELFDRDELAQAYRARWHAELDLRSIKATMQMDVLRCKTPEMVRKEIWAHVLAYNLIRRVMAEAAKCHSLRPRDLSFAGALQAIRAFRDTMALAPCSKIAARYRQLLEDLASQRVGDRPDRSEPRAIKRRPEKHAVLSVPRPEARARLAAAA